MSNKKNFELSEDAKKKIENEFFGQPSELETASKNSAPANGSKKTVKVKRVVPQGTTSSAKSAAASKPMPNTKQVRRQQGRAEKKVRQEPQEEYYPDDDIIEEAPKKKRHFLRKLVILTFVVCVVVILFNVSFLFYRGQIWFNEPRKRDYPVRGAVVDEELGKIDWEIMSQQTISFAYIRATKGTTVVDEQYKASRKGSNKTDLLIGFYHEFDFRLDGAKQAANYIDQCGELDGKLRPMVKVTKYGIYNLKMKDAETVKENLQAFIDAIYDEYGRYPVIMCDSSCYEKYIKPYFSDYSLWLVSHFTEPDEEETNWALWEFNPRTRTEGYANSKEYFSLSVYRQGKDVENFKKNLLMTE